MNQAANRRKILKERIAAGGTLIVPGAYDPLSAKLIERAGFPAVYVGSYATAAARLGMPDVGAVTMDEMVAHAKAIVDAVDIPVLADAEDGWSNAANLWRTIRAFEQAGVCGVHIEDHEFGKHAPVPAVIASLDVMVQKVTAARDARQDPNFLIIARTDVVWARNDIEECIRRLNAFTDAGADIVMAAGITPRQLGAVCSRIKGKVLITDKPGYSVADEEAAGADIVLYYGFTLMAAYDGVHKALVEFQRTRSADTVPGVRERVADFEEFIGYPAFTERARRYGLA
jgi:methylisocitrate lyase